jgi:hypothetical protein
MKILVTILLNVMIKQLCESDGEDQVQHDEMEQQEREMRKENDAMKRSFTKKE